MLKLKNSFQNRTSSLVSTDPSTLGLALLARRGAVMLEKHRVLSGGGPPRGWPRITTASPDSTCKGDMKCKCKCVTCFNSVVYFSRSIRLPLLVLVMCHFNKFIFTASKLIIFKNDEKFCGGSIGVFSRFYSVRILSNWSRCLTSNMMYMYLVTMKNTCSSQVEMMQTHFRTLMIHKFDLF